MKSSAIPLLFLALCFSYLFYHQQPGINLLVFSLLLVPAYLMRSPNLAKRPTWWMAAAGALATGVGAALYGTQLALWGNVAALLLLGAYASAARGSVLVGWGKAAMSVMLAPVLMYLRTDGEKDEAKREREHNNWKSSILLVGGPILAGVVFFMLYRWANPGFEIVTNELDFGFLSWGHLWFVLVGIVVVFGLWNVMEGGFYARWDRLAPNHLAPGRYSGKASFSFLDLPKENLLGVTLFAVLNAVLLFVNVVDIRFLASPETLPEGLTHSDYVHQGVGALITSIMIAIGLLLFFFKGELNFFRGNTGLRVLAYAWIAQNLFMIVSTAYRNHIYVADYSLTFKRIGVFVWLGMALAGLIYTAWKIAGKRTSWYLVREMSRLAYMVLIIATLIDWTGIVTQHQLNKAAEKERFADVGYLLQIGPNNLPDVVHYLNEQLEGEGPFRGDADRWRYKVGEEIEEAMLGWFSTDWPSWSYRSDAAFEELRDLFEQDQLFQLGPWKGQAAVQP